LAEFVIDAGTHVRLGTRADAVERTAAEELLQFLGRIFGTEMPHFGLTGVPGSAAGEPGKDAEGGGIILGTPASSQLIRMLSEPLGLLEVHYDGFVVSPCRSGGEDLLVVASTEPKGVLNGVYRLLDEMGVDFTPRTPTVPSMERFPLAHEIREAPQFSFRAMSGPVAYLARNRMNGVGYPRSMSMAYLDEFARLEWRRRFGDEIERERLAFRDFLASARDFGMKVYVSDVEHWWPDELLAEYPEFAEAGTGHVFCPSRDNWLLFARSRAEEVMREFPDLWGYRVTLADICRASPFERCDACRSISHEERLTEIVRELSEAAAATGTRLIVRTWGMDWRVEAFGKTPWGAPPDWDSVTNMFRINESAPEEVIFESTNTWGADVPGFQTNPWLTEFPDRTRIASFDAARGTHRGCNLIPCSAVEQTRSRMIEIGSAGVGGVLSTGELATADEAAPLGERLGMLNAAAFMRFSWDPSNSGPEVYDRWARAEFAGCAQEMAEVMRGTHEPVTKALMIRSQRSADHSGVPADLGRLEECIRAYGFNDCGGRLSPEVLAPTPRNADAAVREKNEAAADLDRLLEKAGRLGDRMEAADHEGLVLLFEFARSYGGLWRHITEAYFLAGMIASDPERAEQCSRHLVTVCDALIEGALALPDNSGMVDPDLLWGGDACPALTRNIRRSVQSLVADFRDRAAGAASGGVPRDG